MNQFKSMGKMTVADFFCGAGGFSEGFRQMGFDVVFALDHWAPAKATHDLNHPNYHCELKNILELDTPEKIDLVVPDVDIIIGSPPCVSFSGSNKAGKADKGLGIQLIEAFLRIVAWKMEKGVTKFWLMENVPNSSKYVKDRYTWDELGLPGKGKELEIPVQNVFNAAKFGAPQTRRRFICGDYPEPVETHPEEKDYLTMRHVIDSLSNPLNEPPKKVTDPVYNFELSSDKLTDHFYDSTVADFEWKRARRLKQDHGFMGIMSFPEYLDRASRTVMATLSASTRESLLFDAEKNGEKIGYRLPTIREIASFMSFPITYQFEGNSEAVKYKLVGNAVCCRLAAALAKAIAKKEGLSSRPPVVKSTKPASVDLKGMKRTPKANRPKRRDAKFAVHIPYLKIRTFRVELSNRASEFEKGNIIWKCLLHQGTGKKAQVTELNQKELRKVLSKDHDIETFEKMLTERFKSFDLTASELQENYVMNGIAKGWTPEKALDVMKEVIDETFPKEDHEGEFVSYRPGKIKRKEIPLLALLGAYACNHFVSLMP